MLPARDNNSALIGHTGLVGNNLARQHRFDDLYNSSNIHEIAGKSYDLLVCSGVSGTKWVANRNPEQDKLSITRLFECLKNVHVRTFILISTVDVYGIPDRVTETTPIDVTIQTPYGRHRHELEVNIRERFQNPLIVRLPAIYGWQLKKNALYDLMHGHELEKIHSGAVYQFYWLEHLWRDLAKCLDARLQVVNFATEPLAIRTVAKELFKIDLSPAPPHPAPNYNFMTAHDTVLGGKNGYLYDNSTALDEIRTFVAQQRLCKP
jgi:nucleoside-diphosphate-sugar epimerase